MNMEATTIPVKVYPARGGDVTALELTKPTLLRQLQVLVGGYIEIVRIDDKHTLVVNEEGLIHGLPLNVYAESIGVAPFVGNGVIIESKFL